MIKRTCLFAATVAVGANLAHAETLVKGRPSIVLDGMVAQLVVDLGGGSIADFHFHDQGLNPLEWGREGDAATPRGMGHFLCLDRWASVSRAESRNGMPGHGEASRVKWQVGLQPENKDDWVQTEMAAFLPLAGFEVKRLIRLSAKHAFFTVREEVTNTNKLGRIYNMVQHPTIGPPFLDETTVVDANARKGFMAYSPLPNPEEPAVYWPQALNLKNGQPVDMRYLVDDHDPTNADYTIDEDYGWTTASTPAQGLLIGYIWKTADYPWFNIWRRVESGRPVARGLEFGTTGLPLPPEVLVAKGRIFGRALFEYLDAGRTAARVYAAFLCKVPADYRGTARVAYADGHLIVRERDAGPDRDLRTMSLK